LIQNFPNWEKSQNCLQNIILNPEVINSRYYQTVWEDIIKLFLTSIEKALIGIMLPSGFFNTARHTCINSQIKECVGCSEESYYNCHINRIYTFEDDLWGKYQIYQQIGSQSPKNDSFIDIYGYEQYSNFDSFIHKNNHMFTISQNDMCEDLNLEHYYVHPNFVEKKEMDNIDLNVATKQSSEKKIKSSNKIIVKEKDQKNKYKVPTLKDYNIKFTKRENIDKKILRKFRKYLKEKTKKKLH